MKTLITWVGFREDFKQSGTSLGVNENGFTHSIHHDIVEKYGFTRHVILFSADQSGVIKKELETKKRILHEYLKKRFPLHEVECVTIGIDKEYLQDFPTIESAFRSFIQSFPMDEELYVIAGTGPTAVGMAWSTLHMAMDGRFKLYLLQLAEYTPKKESAMLVEVRPYISEILDHKLMEFHIGENLPDEIYKDEIVIREYSRAEQLAKAPDINILILGETGSGKDVLANFIKDNSPLKNKTFKAINCASLPDELLYSELFGHEKGAFTGAINMRIGLFEECQEGTLFMDEIGDISKFMQQSLLRAIENREVKRAGSNDIKKIKPVRIIAATNQNLYQKCQSGDFRFDLYYRLCTAEIELKPFRNRMLPERKAILNHFITVLEKKWGRKLKLSAPAKKILEQYEFKGNFREIYNTINGLMGLGNIAIKEVDLPGRFHDTEALLDENYEVILKKHCIKIFKKYNNDLAATCRALGYRNQTQLRDKFIKWGIIKS